jgi:hypothetical protein
LVGISEAAVRESGGHTYSTRSACRRARMRLPALALFERADEILDLVRAEATLATRRAVRTQVTHVGPTPNGAQRNTELSRRL